MRTNIVGCSVVVGFGLCLAAIARVDEEKVAVDKLPRAVVEAVMAKFPDAKLISAEREEEDGTTVIEVVIEHKGQRIEVCLAAEWKIIEVEPDVAKPAPAEQGEEKVALDKAPKPVIDAVKARFKGAELAGASKETEDGKLVYEVAIKHKGQKIDVTLTPDGAIIMIERQIAAKELPQAVVKTLENQYPKATYKIIEEINKVEKDEEKLLYYEVLMVLADKSALEVQVTAAGKVVNEEKKRSADDE
jgi:uncharacterized membrane protein YkoI